MKEPRILPECHADTLLAEVAGFKANHQPNINEVAKSMEVHFKGSLAIGIVDDDNRIPNYFKTFVVLNTDNGFILKKQPERKHYLIGVRDKIGADSRTLFGLRSTVGEDHTTGDF